jgi:DNA sulfur modification protein DndD
MVFRSLSLYNIGVFRGQHKFDLLTTETEGDRPLIVFRGHNGAGKSTLFHAMKLALHGSLALGDRVSQKEYEDHVFSLFHRNAEDGTPAVTNEAGVTLSFNYIRSGEPLRILVERKWTLSGESVRESLNVLENGKTVDVREDEYQDWINDLVPPGLQPLCFFDAERLRDLADPDSHDDLLADTFYRLLGLHLVDRLEDDLEYLVSQSGSSSKAKRLRREKGQKESVLDQLREKKSEVEAKLDELDDREEELEGKLAEQERRLRSEGGQYAERRPELKQRLSEIKPEMESAAERFEELCEGLLPFALAPSLCRDLRNRIDSEVRTQRQKIADEIWEERKNKIRERLKEKSFWPGLDEDDKKEVVQEVLEALDFDGVSTSDTEFHVIQHLTDEKRRDLERWIERALDVMPYKAEVAADRLRELRQETKQIETELKRAPDEEYLEPIHERIREFEEELDEIESERKRVLKEEGSLSFRIEEVERDIEGLNAKLKKFSASKEHAQMAMKSQRVLREYRRNLIDKRAGELEGALVEAFNRLCRKERLLRDATIDDDFHVELRTANGHKLEVDELSAGERELYVLALLHALREISGRDLPLVVDTPLARLDDVHRPRVLNDYFSEVSRQSILLATDAELEERHLEDVLPQVSKAFRLDFNADEGAAEIEHTHTANRKAKQTVASLDQEALM